MLRDRMKSYQVPQKMQEQGLYPYFRTIESEQDTTVKIKGREILMFGSNSYLGLTNHPRLKEAAKKAIDKYGSACAGSRFLNGTLDIHLELEEKLAHFVGKEQALVFSTGYQVNLGILSSIPSRHDYIIMDELNHACLLDGARLSFAKKLKFHHNNMASLEKVLSKCPIHALKIIAIDGVFSMEGDICPLPEIVALAKKYKANILIDDAHGLGVLGTNGKGTADHFTLSDDIDMIMGTFSKSLASIGGFVASDRDTISFLKHNARSLMFSASIAPGNAASVIAALEIINEQPERLQKLWSNTQLAHELLRDFGFETGNSQTPIIPIYIGEKQKTFKLSQRLLEEGVFVNPIVSPAVPESSSLIRFSIMATHTEDQISSGIEKLAKLGKELNIIPQLSAML